MAAELAVEVVLKWWADLGLKTPVGEVYRPDALHLVAYLNAAGAEYALFHVSFDEGITVALFVNSSLSGIGILAYTVVVGEILQGAISGELAYHAIVWMVRKQEFKYGLSQFFYARTCSCYVHPLGCGSCARCNGSRYALNLNQAEPAPAKGCEFWVVA